MSFMKRTEFIDDLDREIYIFNLMLDMTINCNGRMPSYEDGYYSKAFHVNGVQLLLTDRNASHQSQSFIVSVLDDGLYREVAEWAATCEQLGIMNFWLKARAGITRDKSSPLNNCFSITDGEDRYTESDNLLDSYLENGINLMPEDVYFQESLVRSDFLYKYEDIDRIMEVLNCDLPMGGAFYHHKVKISLDTYHEIYDTIMGMRK